MPELAENETIDWKRLHHHGEPRSASGLRRATLDGKTRAAKTSPRYFALVHKGVGRIEPSFWGRLLPQNSTWPGISLKYRHEKFPAVKPQGYVVGRDSECDLVIDESHVSNRHCLIYRVARNGQVCVFLRDLSSNGTLVNQIVVGCNQVVELKDGDEIAIVDGATFRFHRHDTIYRTFSQQYALLDALEKGHIGRVFVCKEKSTGERFAVKKYSFSPTPESDQDTKESIEAELNLMGICHRNIIFMKEAFLGDASCSHVTQIAENGDLFDMIVRKLKLSEDETRHIFKQLFDAVKYLHERNIVHRDLKPENVLILDEELRVVLCSFGLSITITTQGFDTTLCGTPMYVAPEVVAESRHRKYGREVDIWSLGVVLYICLCGFPPFSDDLYSEDFPYNLGQQIKSARFDYPSPHWDSVGDSALDLIDSMLVVDPKKRFTIEQCLVHPWLTHPTTEVLVKPSPVLRRQPTMLRSGQAVSLSKYAVSSKQSQGPNPGQSPLDPMMTIPESKGKGKISPLIRPVEMQKQDRSERQSVHDEPRCRNPMTIEDIQNDLKSLSLEEKLSKPSSSNIMLSKALQAFRKALAAAQLDTAQDIQGSRSAYQEAHDLLYEAWRHEDREEDKQKLGAIANTWASRTEELSQMLLEKEEDNSALLPRPTSVTWTPPGSPTPSAGQSDVKQHVSPQSETVPPARGHPGPMASLVYDPFAWLINSAISKPITPCEISTELSEDLQNDIEFNGREQELSTWTCTPSAHVPSDEIPLRVDGYPVVLPVDCKYSLTGMFSPPPDPHPLFISPSSQLSDEDIQHILCTFPACLGFYLLANGFLQVIMPDDFDYEDGVPSLPSEFGGLKVSLIPEGVCPTAGEASASSPATITTSTRTRFERMLGQRSTQSAVAGLSGHASANAIGVSVGCAIRAIVPGSKSKQRFEGKTGVAVTPRDDVSKKYITIPTHLLTDAAIASKTLSLDSDTWRKEIKVCVAGNSVELGEVTKTFDQDPKSFPVGFSHDVSLVDISGIPDVPRTIPYAADLAWLSQQEWMDIKYNSSNLMLLDDRSREAKSIGVVDSRCQMVGQGIFRIQQQSRKRSSFLGSLSGSSSSRTHDPRDDPSTWTSLVARSILYRVHPDYPVRGGQSGVPVCVVSDDTDGTAPRSVKVAGFASFVQMVSDVQKYDLEGDKLYKRLQEGRVAFYGAFQVPQELREAYQIL